jgi:chromosome segregation ATPase
MNKCNELEKEIAECQENHARDTEEWKRFQADLQTAVRVANDFMNEAEENMVKMKEEYNKAKETEVQLNSEIESLRKKVSSYEGKSLPRQTLFNGFNKHTKGKLSFKLLFLLVLCLFLSFFFID